MSLIGFWNNLPSSIKRSIFSCLNIFPFQEAPRRVHPGRGGGARQVRARGKRLRKREIAPHWRRRGGRGREEEAGEDQPGPGVLLVRGSNGEEVQHARQTGKNLFYIQYIMTLVEQTCLFAFFCDLMFIEPFVPDQARHGSLPLDPRARG